MPTPDSRPDKVFGRYNELVLLIIGFALTTVIGGYLTNRFQETTQANEERNARLQAEITRATQVSEEISRFMDRRLFRCRKYVWALRNHAPSDERKSAREAYLAAVADWNENLNRLYFLTEYHFGAGMRTTLEDEIQSSFRSIHSSIDSVWRQLSDPNPAPIESAIDALNPVIYGFDEQMQRLIGQGTVGSFLVKEGSSK